MANTFPDAQVGCLLLADITGYSDYLAGTELEHAQDVLADLLETIIGGIEPPFELSKLEGDAAFAYRPMADMDAPMLMDTIESTYFAFRRRLRDVVHATTCDCNACALIPSLDLKFVVHSGAYIVRRRGRNEELTGSDVVIVHRLLKNTVRDVVGDDAYVAYTEAVVEAVAADLTNLSLVAHTEHLDTGEVELFVQNLEERWRFEESRQREFITPQTATATITHHLPVEPKLVWPWLTEPMLRTQWGEGLTSVTEEVDTRRGIGTVNHCAHGDDVVVQELVDWQPFSSFTTKDRASGVSPQRTELADGGRCSRSQRNSSPRTQARK